MPTEGEGADHSPASSIEEYVEMYLHSAIVSMACIGAAVPLRLPRTSVRNVLRTVCVVLCWIRSVYMSVLCSRTPYTCLDLITYHPRLIGQ